MEIENYHCAKTFQILNTKLRPLGKKLLISQNKIKRIFLLFRGSLEANVYLESFLKYCQIQVNKKSIYSII